MTNKYGIPNEELEKIRKRDKRCVYCKKEFRKYTHLRGSRKDIATIEHLNNVGPWDNPKTVAYCCGSCNSSRGAKVLRDWFSSEYCKNKNINEGTVAEPVKKYLRSRVEPCQHFLA